MTVNFVARVDIVTSALWVAMAMQLFKRALEVIIEMFLSSCWLSIEIQPVWQRDNNRRSSNRQHSVSCRPFVGFVTGVITSLCVYPPAFKRTMQSLYLSHTIYPSTCLATHNISVLVQQRSLKLFARATSIVAHKAQCGPQLTAIVCREIGSPTRCCRYCT